MDKLRDTPPPNTVLPDEEPLSDEELVPITGLPGPGTPHPQLLRLPYGRTAEVHCVRTVPEDLVETMSRHRTALLRAHTVDELEQYVVVVGAGELRSHDDPVHTGIHSGIKLLHVKDVEKEWFPISPGFSILGRSRTAPPSSEILETIGATAEAVLVSPAGNKDGDTKGDGDALSEIREQQPALPAQLVSLFFEGRFGVLPDLPAECRTLSWAPAVTTALAIFTVTQFDEVRQRIGRREGIADVLGDVLRERFGEHRDISTLAYRLAALPDLDAVIQIIAAADDLAGLYAKYLDH